MNTVFEVYDRSADSPPARPLTLTEVVARIDANSTVRTLVERLFRRKSLNEDDLAALLGEDVQVKSWCPRDFCKDHPDEVDMCAEGTFMD